MQIPPLHSAFGDEWENPSQDHKCEIYLQQVHDKEEDHQEGRGNN